MLPSTIKAEVKLTTSARISVAARELTALAVAESDAVGLVAALFVGDERDLECRWIIVDAANYSCRRRYGVSVARPGLVATARTQRWLNPLRRHVEESWPAFLQAFADTAERGHGDLVKELDALHHAGRLRESLPRERVLAVEHFATTKALVERHGESDAGRIVQDLLAYLIASAGYRKVTLNAVGVPDFVLEDGAPSPCGDSVMLSMAREDAERMAALCRAGGNERLADLVERNIGA